MNYTDRYRQLAQQRAYERSVRAIGLPALLEPYAVRPAVVLPEQRAREARISQTA